MNGTWNLMSQSIVIEPLTPEAFSAYGDIIDASGEPTSMINNGMCARYNNLAQLNFDPTGQAGISIFEGQPYTLPHAVSLVERHPLGSQAFIPMSDAPFLVVVAGDNAGTPTVPRAFLMQRLQGVNIHRNVWHGVLTPLKNAARFAVIDWIGEGVNLEEFVFDKPWLVVD